MGAGMNLPPFGAALTAELILDASAWVMEEFAAWQ